MSGPTATLDIFQDGSAPAEDEVVLEGQMSGPASSGGGSGVGSGVPPEGFNTLDEPIKETIMRDIRAVGQKFYHVLYPVEKTSLLKVNKINRCFCAMNHHPHVLQEWDLWGPLILCTFMATVLQGHDTSSDKHGAGDGGPEFAEVFVIVWLGALIVTLNTKLLGGHISFFQSVCVLGYCLLPLSISLIICRVLLLASHTSTVLFLIRCASVAVGFLWAAYASMQFLGDCQPEKRKALAAYPMFLFYFVISWMVISHSG